MSADLVLRGTVHPAADAPVTDAVAVRSGRVVALGWQAVAPLVGPRTEVHEVAGAVLPGFVDAHVHPLMGGLQRLGCDLSDLHDIDAYRQRIVAHCERPGEWLVGSGWYGDVFPGGFPRADELDRLTGDRPACLMSHDGHGVWVNSAALLRAGIGDDTPDPDGGRIHRDPGGRASGLLLESAAQRVTDLLPEPGAEQIEAALLEAQDHLHSLGIVGWQDAGVGRCLGIPDSFAAYRSLESRGALTARVTGDLWWEAGAGLTQLESHLERRALASGPRFRATAIKIMQDGVCENLTAAVIDPYHGMPHEHGLSFIDPAELARIVPALAAEGFDVHLHAVGDRAVRESLDAITAAPLRRDARHQIAHIDLVAPTDVGRFADLGVIANVSPLWAREDQVLVETKLPYLTTAQREHHFAFGALHSAGAALAFGSDWPVSSPDPLWAIHVAVNRTAPLADPHAQDAHARRVPLLPGEAVDVATAVRAATQGAAHAARLDDLGSLRVGAPASLVLLDADPFAVEPGELSSIRVMATYVDGVVVFAR